MHRHLISTLLTIACTAAFAQAAEPLPPPRYSLKQDTADTGTHIKRNVAERSAIPLNRRYDELTADEQALVKSQYEGMAADDEPPFPARGLAPIYRSIGGVQRHGLASGPLTLFVDVDKDGQATSVSVLSAPDDRTAKEVAAVLMRARYKPARCAGQPCAMAYPFRMQLEVR